MNPDLSNPVEEPTHGIPDMPPLRGRTDPRRAPSGGSLGAMRWIDHWVGLPLCLLLGMLVTMRRRLLPGRELPIREGGTIVVFKFFGLGSIIEATPLLRAIRRRYPRTRLAFLTFSPNRALLERLNLCDEVRVIRTRPPPGFVIDTLRELAWLRRRDVDAIVDLEFFSKFSTLMAAVGGGRRRVGYHLNDFWRFSLLTHPVYFNYYRHITDLYAHAGRQIDVTVESQELSAVPVDDRARSRVARSLEEQGWMPGGRVIGINVNAGDLSLERRWPPEHFARLIEELLRRHRDLCVVLTGSPDESEYVQGIWNRLGATARPKALVTAGRWTLDDFLASFERMTCFVTNDSGPMHLAAAQGTPLVSLWGPGRPEFYAPRVPNHEVIYQRFPCSPCLYMFTTFEGMWCNHEGPCMQVIAPAQVLAAVERRLAMPV